MRRHVTQEETYHLIEQFRKEVPGIHLRTTLMVGHPGETEADFEELKEFLRKARFDRMGLLLIPKKKVLMLLHTMRIKFLRK